MSLLKMNYSKNLQCSTDCHTSLASPEPSSRPRQRERRPAVSKRAQTPFYVTRFSICSYEEDVKEIHNLRVEAQDGTNKPSILRSASKSEYVDIRIANVDVEFNSKSPPTLKKLSSVQFSEEVEIIGREVRNNRNSPSQSRGTQHRREKNCVSQSMKLHEVREMNGDETLRGRSRARTRLEKISPTSFIPRRMTSDDWEQTEQEKSTSTDRDITNSIPFSHGTSASRIQSAHSSATSRGQREGRAKIETGTQTPFSLSPFNCKCRYMEAREKRVNDEIRRRARAEGNTFEWKPLVIWAVANLVGVGLMNYAA